MGLHGIKFIIMEKYNIEPYSNQTSYNEDTYERAKIRLKKLKGFKNRIFAGFDEAWVLIRKLWIWILVGVGIGAIIHNYVPETFIQNLVGKAGIFGVPLAVLLGIPMYGNSVGIVPVAVALFEKGVPLGTALAFMMAITALSFPEAIILRRAMKLKLIAIFFAVVTVAIIISGYLLNMLSGIL